jgi:hypothetical protein
MQEEDVNFGEEEVVGRIEDFSSPNPQIYQNLSGRQGKGQVREAKKAEKVRYHSSCTLA